MESIDIFKEVIGSRICPRRLLCRILMPKTGNRHRRRIHERLVYGQRMRVA